MASFIAVIGGTFLVNFFVLCAGLEESSSVFQGVSEVINPLFLPVQEGPTGVKRYPQHLDPTLLKFWIQVGECPESPDGAKQYYCSSLTGTGRQVCIDDYQLCNGVKECPNAEDENKHYCLFYKALKSQVELLERSMASLNTDSHRKSPVRRYASPFTSYDYK